MIILLKLHIPQFLSRHFVSYHLRCEESMITLFGCLWLCPLREIGFGLYGHLSTSSGLHLTRVELLQIKWIDREGFLHNLLKLLFVLILCSLVLFNSRLFSIFLFCSSYIHCWYVDYDTYTKYLILLEVISSHCRRTILHPKYLHWGTFSWEYRGCVTKSHVCGVWW